MESRAVGSGFWWNSAFGNDLALEPTPRAQRTPPARSATSRHVNGHLGGSGGGERSTLVRSRSQSNGESPTPVKSFFQRGANGTILPRGRGLPSHSPRAPGVGKAGPRLRMVFRLAEKRSARALRSGHRWAADSPPPRPLEELSRGVRAGLRKLEFSLLPEGFENLFPRSADCDDCFGVPAFGGF